MGFMDKIGKKVQATMDNAVLERNKRLKTPEFKRKMVLERRGVLNSLNNTGKKAKEAGYKTMLAAASPIWQALLAVAGEKKFSTAMGDMVKQLSTAGWSVSQTFAAAGLTAGRAARMGARGLIAK